MTKAECKELHVLAANVRDDRLRGLIFKLLDAIGYDPNEKEEDDWRKRQSHAGDEGRSGRGR